MVVANWRPVLQVRIYDDAALRMFFSIPRLRVDWVLHLGCLPAIGIVGMCLELRQDSVTLRLKLLETLALLVLSTGTLSNACIVGTAGVKRKPVKKSAVDLALGTSKTFSKIFLRTCL